MRSKYYNFGSTPNWIQDTYQYPDILDIIEQEEKAKKARRCKRTTGFKPSRDRSNIRARRGIWHFIIMHRSDCNERGAATYQQWYPNRGKYAGTVSDCITQEIFVKSIPKAAEDNNFEDKNQKATTQYINHATIVNQYGEKNVHIDHVDTLNL